MLLMTWGFFRKEFFKGRNRKGCGRRKLIARENEKNERWAFGVFEKLCSLKG